MASFHKKYADAFNAAVDLARELNREVGLEKFKEYNTPGFRVFMLPKLENRCGFELRAQVVRPNEPKMAQ